MILTDKQYKYVKRILTMLVPGVSALIVTFGGLYGFDTKVIVGTITAVATFAGVALEAFSQSYDKTKDEELK